MATVTKPIALDESFNTTEATPRNIADVLAKGIGDLIHAVSQIAPQTTYDLDDLGDVDITSPSNGQVLKYNGTSQKWENETGGGSGDSVSWSQIQQSGTKIAEIEINGVTTDVYAPTGGGGFSALIVITAATGQTVTVSKGGDTYTAVETSSGTYEVSVDSMGTWTVTDGTNTDTVTVSQQTTYYVTLFSVPDGKTVLPTDDVSIWLACGGRSEAYTTLSEVLNDSVCLSSLIADSNAVDYLVRSKSFAKSEALVPAMTSDTTPSGVVSASDYIVGNEPWRAFNGNFNSYGWRNSGSQLYVNQYITYEFPSNVKPAKAKSYLYREQGAYATTMDIEFYNSADGVDFSNQIGTAQLVSSNVAVDSILNSGSTRYVRAKITSNSAGISGHGMKFQFYTEDGLCDNATAMSYIGLNNYASNTLLADSTWCSAICNSTYFESVLNVKVPTLTENTSAIISNGQYGDDWPQPQYQYPQYRVFDNDDISYWLSRQGTGYRYIGYDFNEPVQLCKVTLVVYLANNDLLIKGSDDGTTWDTIKTIPKADVPANTTVSFDIFELTKYSKYIAESYVPNASGSNYAWYGKTIQFYGRADV